MMDLVLDDGGPTYRLVVPDDLRSALTEALAEDLRALQPLLALESSDGEDARAWHRAERSLLDGLLAMEPAVCFPAAGSSNLHGLITKRAVDAIQDGQRANALAWVALWAEFPERPDLA
jgi:hypothetical protein